MNPAPRIWLTRPTKDSIAIADMLTKNNIPSIVSPLLIIEPIPDPSPIRGKAGWTASDSALTGSPPPLLPPNWGGVKHPDALLLTSRHAAHALHPAWSHLPVYCVGTATAETARKHGFSHIILGDGDALSLLPPIAESLKNKTLLYLSGEDISLDVVTLLASQSVRVERVIAYRAVAATQLMPELIDAFQNNHISGAALFSARTAEIANTIISQANLIEAIRTTDAYCLSLAIAEKAANLPWRRIHVAHSPTADAMQAMIIQQHHIN